MSKVMITEFWQKSTCPTCGSDVRIVSNGLTHHYEPESENAKLQERLKIAIGGMIDARTELLMFASDIEDHGSIDDAIESINNALKAIGE